jgi:hypothetical protein
LRKGREEGRKEGRQEGRKEGYNTVKDPTSGDPTLPQIIQMAEEKNTSYRMAEEKRSIWMAESKYFFVEGGDWLKAYHISQTGTVASRALAVIRIAVQQQQHPWGGPFQLPRTDPGSFRPPGTSWLYMTLPDPGKTDQISQTRNRLASKRPR